MKITTGNENVTRAKADLLAAVVHADDLKGSKRKRRSKEGVLAALDAHFGGSLRSELQRQGFEASDGQQVVLRSPGGLGSASVLLVGWREEENDGLYERAMRYRKLGAAIRRTADDLRCRTAALAAADLDLKDESYASALLEGVRLAGYRFNRYKSGKKPAFKGLEGLRLLGGNRISESMQRRSESACAATESARDMINTPACDCYPASVVRQCREVARRRRLGFKAYGVAELKRLGAGALLAVGQGSANPPALVRLVYKPARRKKIVALVGKGVTFDSGGLTIKPYEGMTTMKCDMSGAAAVIAVMDALHTLKPEVEVRAYIPLAENMSSGRAVKPGDVVRAVNGKSIEILNCDAEGRLILADALSLAVREKPDQIVDLATLTGACVVALGDDYAGLFSSDDTLAAALQEASAAAGERLWRLPLAPEYRSQLKSSVADLKNVGGGRMGGAITAALFLQEFTGGLPWAHLDIAGPAFGDKDSGHLTKGGVGFGVRTVLGYLARMQKK